MPVVARACTKLLLCRRLDLDQLTVLKHAERGIVVNPFVFLICGAVGYCPDPRPRPKPGPLPRDPVAGGIGGIIGGYAAYVALSLEGSPNGMELVAILIGAYAFGRVFQEVASWIIPDRMP